MRTTTAAERTDLAALDRKELVRVYVANSGGSLVEFTDWFHSASLTATIDNIAMSGTVTFWREIATGSPSSLVPLMNATAPIAPGRRITVDVGVVSAGETVTSGLWRTIFDGFVDEVEWGGDDSQLVCQVRDKASELLDTYIEVLRTYGDNSSPTAIETVMQTLLDDNLGSAVETLTTVGNPDFGIKLYEQQHMSLAQGLQQLAELIGWDLRYEYVDSPGGFNLVFQEPDRDKTTPDHTFGVDDYFSLVDVAQTQRQVRNVCIVKWTDGTTEGEVTATDSASVAELGRQTIILDYTNSPHINTEAKATALAQAVIGDASQPALTHVAECSFFWPVELGDLYRFTANNVHYDANQDVAVTTFTHFLSPEGNTTTLGCRGSPAGSVTRWARKSKITREQTEIVEPDVPTLLESLKVLYTTKSGTAGYQNAGTASGSLGGYISTTEVTADTNGLFESVSDAERQAGGTWYKSIGVINDNDFPSALTWGTVKAWLSDAGSNGVTWSIGTDPVGVADFDRAAKLGAESADDETAPASSPAITYVSPDSIVHDDVLSIGNVAPGEGFILHIRLQLSASPDPTPQITDELIYFSDTV